MVIASRFPPGEIVGAHFDAIKFGLQNDIAGPEHIIFYGNQGKAALITAKHGGIIVAARNKIGRRGN